MHRTIWLLLTIGSLAGCAGTPPVVLVERPQAHRIRWGTALDIRLAKVDFDGLPMIKAIDLVNAEASKVYPPGYYLGASYESTSDPMLQKRRPNPRVSFHGRGVTVREVFSAITRPVGWKYDLRFNDCLLFTLP